MAMTVWPSDKQFKKHKVDPIKAAIRMGGPRELATNHFGRPEAVFYYRKDDITMHEYCCDVDCTKYVDPKTNKATLQIISVLYLCPRCGQSCMIRAANPDIPQDSGSMNIEVHWSDMRQSPEDGKWRPTFTVKELLICDYTWEEINGISSPRSVSRCGWRGRIEAGRCHDVDRIILPASK